MPAKTEQAIIISDVHSVFYDRAAWRQMIDIVKGERPTHAIILGDLWDMVAVCRHGVKRIDRGRLAEDRDCGVELAHEFYEACGPQAQRWLFEGNHEVWWRLRLERSSDLAVLPELSIEEFFRLDDLGLDRYVPYGDLCILWRKVMLEHGSLTSKKAGYTAQRMMDEHWMSGVSGHTHRQAFVQRSATSCHVINNHRPFFWVENGCLCSNSPHYRRGGGVDWQHGFTVLHKDRYGVEPELVRLNGNNPKHIHM